MLLIPQSKKNFCCIVLANTFFFILNLHFLEYCIKCFVWVQHYHSCGSVVDLFHASTPEFRVWAQLVTEKPQKPFMLLSGLSLTHILNWISIKPIIYRLFSILNSDFIHHFCFYNVWTYPRSHSAMRIIRVACYRKFYFDFPSPLLAYRPLAKPARVPLTQLIPLFTHTYTHLPLFHCYLL